MSVSDPIPEIVVVVEDPTAEVVVNLAEVGLVGPPGESDGGAALADHIDSPTPHPVYDDGPSLALLYENAKAGA